MKRLLFILCMCTVVLRAQDYPGYKMLKQINPPVKENVKILGYILSKDDKSMAAIYQVTFKSKETKTNTNPKKDSVGYVISIFYTNQWKKRIKDDFREFEIDTENLRLSFFSQDHVYFYIPKKGSKTSDYYGSNTTYGFYRINLATKISDIVKYSYEDLQKTENSSKFSNGNDKLLTNNNEYSIFADNSANTYIYKQDEKYALKNLPDSLKEKSEVDYKIPMTGNRKSNAYALVIGNEDYSSKQPSLRKEQNVPFANNDALIFKEYLIKTLGIPERQIRLNLNATSAQIGEGIDWLYNVSKSEDGNAEIIFYYSGHGLPDESTKEAFLIPVDVSGNNISHAVKINELVKKIGDGNPKVAYVIFDACFSGGAKGQPLVTNKAVKVRPKENPIQGNILILSSSSGDEASSVFEEQKHGYFTYYLLKKMQESKGETTIGDLYDYIHKNVRKETSIIGKPQTPELRCDDNMKQNIYKLKFK